jgi:mono/diheme cytochrome c family protein
VLERPRLRAVPGLGGLVLLAGLAGLALAVACSSPSAPSAASAAAPPTAAPPAASSDAKPAPPAASTGAKPAPAAASSGAKPATKVNIDAIFPPDTGRELVLQNCVNCHTIAPIALAQMTPGEWSRHRQDHRPRVGAISDAEADVLWAYLVKHFGPDHQVPTLPQELLDTWTSY